jgi:hypothetical protein
MGTNQRRHMCELGTWFCCTSPWFWTCSFRGSFGHGVVTHRRQPSCAAMCRTGVCTSVTSIGPRPSTLSAMAIASCIHSLSRRRPPRRLRHLARAAASVPTATCPVQARLLLPTQLPSGRPGVGAKRSQEAMQRSWVPVRACLPSARTVIDGCTRSLLTRRHHRRWLCHWYAGMDIPVSWPCPG